MATTPRTSIDAVVRSICGQSIRQLAPLTGGGLNEAYRAELTGGVPVVVRIARRPVPWFTDEARAMRLAHAAGVPAPEVLGVEHVDHEGQLLSFSLLGFVSGRPLDELAAELPTEVLDRLLMDCGELLARLHSAELPDDLESTPSLTTHRLRPLDAQATARVVEVAGRALGTEAVAVVRRGVDFLRREAQRTAKPRLALAHGDYLPKHLLIDDQHSIVGIIDWEFAGMAPPALDLAHWEASARAGLHSRVELVRRGYARITDPDTADEGLVPAFAVHFALDVLGWRNPASPERLQRCVAVIDQQLNRSG